MTEKKNLGHNSKKDFLKYPVEHIDITSFDSIKNISSMEKMSFVSRETANAANIYNEMLRDKECTIFLTLAGSTSAAGCMNIYKDLVKYNMVDAIVATGASIIDMDFFEALGFKHYQGSQFQDDTELRKNYIDRIYDTYIDEDELQICDKKICEIADGLIPTIRELGVPVLEEVSSPTMFRIGSRKAPHNLYADTELVREYIDSRGYLFNQDVKPLYTFGNDQTSWLDGANRITIEYSEFTTVIWKNDNEQYNRFIVDSYSPEDDAVAHNFITRDGYTDILKVPTIVVIQGPLYNDEATTLPSVLTVGVGPLTIFHNGKYIEGTWRRNDIADQFEFLDSNQNVIEVPPSKQWIHIVPVSYTHLTLPTSDLV